MGEPERLTAGRELGPADPRHASIPQADRAAWCKTEAGDAAVLLALVECELEAEADSEDRPARFGTHAQRRVEPAAPETPHRGTG